MNKYKINIVYSDIENNIDDIFIKTLKKDINKFLNNNCKRSNEELTSTCTYLSIKKEDRNVDDR